MTSQATFSACFRALRAFPFPLNSLCLPLKALCPPLKALCPPLRALCAPLRALCAPLRALRPPLRALRPPLRALSITLRALSITLRALSITLVILPNLTAAGEPTGRGTIDAVFEETNVEIDFTFDYESLPQDLKQRVISGDGVRVTEGFQNLTGMFNFPSRSICHIEDVSVKSDPVFQRKPEVDQPPIDYSAGKIRVSYTYCCDAASRRKPITGFDTNAFHYLTGLSHIDTRIQADRRQWSTRETLTAENSRFELPPAAERAASRGKKVEHQDP